MDTWVAHLWQEMYTWPLVHWAMIEAIVAAVCFVVPWNSCGSFGGVETIVIEFVGSLRFL